MSLFPLPNMQEASVAVVAFQASRSIQLRFEWEVSLRNERSGQESQHFTLNDPFRDSEYEALRWYVEDYAVKDPFAEEKAKRISKSQDYYKEKLIQSLESYLRDVLDIPAGISSKASFPSVHLLVHGDGTRSSLHSLLWELVERKSTFESTFHFTVTRMIHPIDPPLQLEDRPKHKSTLNVLYVSARPGLENDISYRAISRDISALMKRKMRPEEINLQFVRPGTWAKFLEVLHENKDNTFDLAHFDMHGSIVRQTDNEMYLALNLSERS